MEIVWREERATLLATLTRRLGDLDLAEDALQDAFAIAAVRWPVDGVPDRPGAWLLTTAWRRALDVVRRARRVTEPSTFGADYDTEAAMAAPEAPTWQDESDLRVEDDLLRLVITCCHPALAPEARVALTLRHVAGLTSREIASAFLVPEVTMDKRLVRARAKIRDARIAFELPSEAEFPSRLADVLAVLYLIFSEGYASSSDGARLRTDLCDEAIWLARQVCTMRRNDGECVGLLALMLLQRARAAARLDDAGHLVAYDEQDRSRWNTSMIQEARALLATTGRDALGPYQVEAAIALMHATASNSASVPWIRIAELYTVLQRMTPTPVIALNRAYAMGRAHAPGIGLLTLAPLLREQTLARYAPLYLVHADLLRRDGQIDAAVNAWQVAIELSADPGQRAALRRRAARLGLILPATAAE